jgi:HD-like signal output (HDOD) protein
MIAHKWRLGAALIETLAHHHNPAGCDDKSRDLVAIVSLANQITIELQIGEAGDCPNKNAMPARLQDTLGVEYDNLSEFQETISSEIDKARIFLEIVQK